MIRDRSSGTTVRLFIFLTLLLLAVPGAGPPVVVRKSTPVGPNDTALFVGEGFDEGCEIKVGRLADAPCSAPAEVACSSHPQLVDLHLAHNTAGNVGEQMEPHP